MKPAPLPAATRFELRNSLWMNAAHAVLYTFLAACLAFLSVMIVSKQKWSLVWVLPVLVVAVWGALNRWKWTFDRSVQLVIDETGILARRSRFGQIRWSDLTSAGFHYGRSTGVLILTFKDVEPWLGRANWLTRTIFSYKSNKPFSAGLSLTQMPCDCAALHHFVATKVTVTT